MLLESVWAQAVELRRLLGRLCDPAAERVAAELGLNGPGWALLRRAYLAVPQPVSASRLSALNPGVNPWIYEAGLQHLAALGLLAGVEDGAYVVTPAGQSAATSILYALDTRLRELAPLAPEPLERLAELLAALVSASLLAPEPPHKTLLRLSHAPAAAGPLEASVRLDQALSDLAATTKTPTWPPGSRTWSAVRHGMRSRRCGAARPARWTRYMPAWCGAAGRATPMPAPCRNWCGTIGRWAPRPIR